jgi:hypothetical protein
LESFLRINTPALPNTNGGVLAAREYPPIAACPTTSVEAASGARCERGYDTLVTSVCEDSLDIQIRAAGCGVEVLVRGRNDPSLDSAIVACSAHFRLTWATAATEYYTPDDIEVPT